MVGFAIKALGAGVAAPLTILLCPKPVPGPKRKQLPYEKRPKLYDDIKNHPNKHYVTREPKKIGIIGAGCAGIIYGKTLQEQGYDIQIYEK